jgi:hypothetical protein
MATRIEDLIESAWGFIYADFDGTALHQWRRGALDCPSDMLRPGHVYTRHFENLVRQGKKTEPLVSGGMLTASEKRIAGTGIGAGRAHGSFTSAPMAEK